MAILPFGINAPGITDFWSIALYDLNLTEEQFLLLTPSLFQILCFRKYQNDRRELSNVALITATIINVNREKGKRAVSIEDIIGKDNTIAPKEPMPEELLTLVNVLHKKHGKKSK